MSWAESVWEICLAGSTGVVPESHQCAVPESTTRLLTYQNVRLILFIVEAGRGNEKSDWNKCRNLPFSIEGLGEEPSKKVGVYASSWIMITMTVGLA